jgi:hypothetical protein
VCCGGTTHTPSLPMPRVGTAVAWFGLLGSSRAEVLPPGWRVANNTNLRHGDATSLDFRLSPGTSDDEAVAACLGFCANHSVCAAFVMVRGSGGSHRCAIKGHETNWCGPVEDAQTVSGIKPGVPAQPCPAPAPAPAPPGPGEWRLPQINWNATGIVGPTAGYAVRAFDVINWTPDGKWYLYCDLVLFTNPECPSSFGSEIGIFSAPSLDGEWTYHGIAVPKNSSTADAGGLATPTAIVHGGQVRHPSVAGTAPCLCLRGGR